MRDMLALNVNESTQILRGRTDSRLNNVGGDDDDYRLTRRSTLQHLSHRIRLLPSNSHFQGTFRLFSVLPSKQEVRNFPYPKPLLLSELYPITGGEFEIVGRAVRGNERFSKSSCGAQEVADFIQFDFSGVMIKASFCGTKAFLSMDGQGAFFNVFIDGAFVRIIESYESSGVPFIYELCPTQQFGTHTVTVSKRTEAVVRNGLEWFDPCTVYGMFVEGGGDIKGELLPCDNTASKPMIEFIGDSDTTAFGNEGPPTSIINLASMVPAKQNAWNSYAAQTARAFDADYCMICWTAIGATSTPPIPGTDYVLQRKGQRQLYNRTIANDKDSLWHGPPADLAVIFLGGNDLTQLASECKEMDKLESYCNKYAESAMLHFIRCQKEVIGKVRKRSPDAPILVVAPSNHMMSAELHQLAQAQTATMVRSGCRKAVEAYTAETKDKNVHFKVLCPSQNFCDPSKIADDTDDNTELRAELQQYWASLAHWSILGHQQVAESLVKHIEDTVPGWKRKRDPAPCAECLTAEPERFCQSFTVIASMFYYTMCLAVSEAVLGIVLVAGGFAGAINSFEKGKEARKDSTLINGYNIMEAVGFYLITYSICTAVALSYEYSHSITHRYMYYWSPATQLCCRRCYFAVIVLFAPLVVMIHLTKSCIECCVDCFACACSCWDSSERKEWRETEADPEVPIIVQ